MLQVTFTDQELEQVAAMVAGDLDARCDTPVLRTAFLKLMQASTEAKSSFPRLSSSTGIAA
jgi:hypothetical protein